MNLKDKHVLITGAGGFIGSHLTEKLIDHSKQVSVFLRYTSKSDRGLLEYLPKELLEKVKFFWGDLKDHESVYRAVKGQDVVFHLAAHIPIPYSYVNPLDVIQTNVLGTAHVLGACREYGVSKLVQTSTSETYGTAMTVPINEQHPAQGQSPYAASKIAADKIAESYYRSFDLPVAILRPFNTFGPRQSARAIIPTIISQALSEPEISLGSLTPTRDLTFVLDTVNGFIKCAESDATIGQVVNVGTGKEVSMGDLVTKIQQILGTDKKVVTDKNRLRPAKSEVQRLLCGYSKAEKIMSWQPQYTLEDGLKITIDWVRENLHRYRSDTYTI